MVFWGRFPRRLVQALNVTLDYRKLRRRMDEAISLLRTRDDRLLGFQKSVMDALVAVHGDLVNRELAEIPGESDVLAAKLLVVRHALAEALEQLRSDEGAAKDAVPLVIALASLFHLVEEGLQIAALPGPRGLRPARMGSSPT